MIKALPGYVVISPLDEEIKTTSGIIVSSQEKDRPVKGVVLDVGSQTATEGPPVKVGQTIFYRKWSGDEIKQGEKSVRVIAFKDCIAIDG